MNSKVRVLAVVAVLALAVLAGFYATESQNTGKNERNVVIEACDSLPDYDYERMVERVEDIKGEQLKRNLSICVEQEENGIDTTTNQRQFARIEEPGLSFFGLNSTTNSQQRSSLGHTEFSPSGGPIEIFLANETVVENVSWISYEGLVVHELNHAIEIAEQTSRNATSTERVAPPQTTDEILVRQALGNGVSMYVADLYVQKYGGYLNVSVLSADAQNWKRRVIQSVYSAGYRYSKQTDQRTEPTTDWPNSTAQILHPNETQSVTGLPSRPDLPIGSLEHVRTDRIGELFLRETLVSKGISFERASTAADGWTNDRMDYFRTDGSAVVTWRVTWQNSSEKDEFVEVYNEVYDYETRGSFQSVSCRESGRYLVTSKKSVTFLFCDS
ncbi:hypothetical protein [Halorussus ruber]|uniref:hypothetical protein n=1 Tax=Halorussus ruber TaxID=1126238 RepID=UPI0010929026|nr:hypothetical protein [Halorussus ruber]